MLISASRRTDIPAFFGEWFINRINAGFFCAVNPFNPKQVKRVSLAPEDVDAIVFWTRNVRPFLKYLSRLDELGYNYYFQYTLNDYPREFEPNLPPLDSSIDAFKILSDRIGPQRVLWRYDPIMLSNLTPAAYHLDKIQLIASRLTGYTTRLTISFLDMYRKTEYRLKRLQAEKGIQVYDILSDSSALSELCRGIAKIGREFNLEVVTCGEAIDLTSFGINKGSCIDPQLLRQLFQIKRDLPRDPNQRGECLCAQAVDMGHYNTCKFGCVYCYASYSPKTITRNLKQHDVNSPVLVGTSRCYQRS